MDETLPIQPRRGPASGEAGPSAIVIEVLRNMVFLALMGSIAWVLIAAGDQPDGGAPLLTDALCIHQPAGE